jgi:neutral ceramidase
VAKVVGVVHEALAHRTPATLWTGQGSVDVAVNRRNNAEAQVPKLREQGVLLKGPTDHDVPVLLVRAPGGELRAAVLGYACHATTLDGYQWCGDYPGYAQAALEEKHPGMQAMFYIGCGADQNPLPRRTVALCQQYGTRLAAAVDDVLAGKMQQLPPKLKTAFQFTEVGLEGIATREGLKSEAKQGIIYARRAERLGKLLDQGVQFPNTYSIPVQAWKLGDRQLWIMLGGEVVVDYARMFKESYGRQTWVAGYSDEVMAYIPSERVWKEGRYEANAFYVYGMPASQWAPDIQQKLTSAVARLVKGLD